MDILGQILNQLPEAIHRQQDDRIKLERLIHENRKNVVIYGYGNLGRYVAQKLSDIFDITIAAYVDTYRETDLTIGLYNINDVQGKIKGDALVIVAIYSIQEDFDSIKNSLYELGFQNIISAYDLYALPELTRHGLIGYDLPKIDVEQVNLTYDILGDIKSKETYCNLFNFILSSKKIPLSTEGVEKQYVPSDLYKTVPDERIVDCGAFDGDTMRSFWKALSPYGFDSYIAVEPDFKNRERLSRSIEVDIPQHAQNRVRIIPAAVSNQSGEILFNNTGTASSAKASNTEGAISVPVVRLDDVIDSAVTLIKMDIEGFELLALQGAEQIIKKYQPLMAVCGYHRFEDLWEIPLYLHKLLPDHEIVFRNYVGLIEYVFYAIPKERMLK
ncbi:FkbM family methyltransferase [Intestinimonas butyriciproducens]|uniref:FkbM family methyltransferase n=1 Tax=Intestinimonas butyriciproducens TaxID=1297617 RepID=UPI00195E9507|nr:FkbM family methyltransferase [Intestinimonas butyriciproducens]MBM6974930.1 FkbM family methyltransferase [Intestinimonas butyriciproducens]